MTPAGVTRALRPMEKLGMVSTVKSKRDARLAIAALTPAGREVLEDAGQVVNDTARICLERSPKAEANIATLTDLLDDLAR
ncbi:MAG: winged helix-turn-helix transcriptional regulator, partial [Woeseia sp.]|nr:winged helix-turn-helix transcriptional regulator [Woeseia sp.]